MSIPKINQAYNSYTAYSATEKTVTDLRKQVEDLKAAALAKEANAKKTSKPVYQNETPTSDPMASFGIMFEDVVSAAKFNGLKLRSISYNTSPQKDVVYANLQALYNVCEVKMELIGNYSQFRSYFEDIYNYPYLMNISEIEINPYEKNPRILIGTISVVLYAKK